MNGAKDRAGWSSWLMYAALAVCPLSKIVAAGLIGGSMTAILLDPWFLVLVLPPAIAAAVTVVRRTRRNRSVQTRQTPPGYDNGVR